MKFSDLKPGDYAIVKYPNKGNLIYYLKIIWMSTHNFRAIFYKEYNQVETSCTLAFWNNDPSCEIQVIEDEVQFKLMIDG